MANDRLYLCCNDCHRVQLLAKGYGNGVFEIPGLVTVPALDAWLSSHPDCPSHSFRLVTEAERFREPCLSASPPCETTPP